MDEQPVVAVPCQFSKEQQAKGQELMFYTLWYNKTLKTDDVLASMRPWTKDADLIKLQ